jgi:enoyl-CoA hydratase/carnithine racemase
MSELVKIELDKGVADVRLARPEKLNALDPAMFEAIAGAIARLGDLPGLRCVVLSGEGKGFCAGIDLGSLAGPALLDVRARSHGEANIFQHVAWGWRKLAVPVIAAVHGVAFGAGFQIMLGADIRIAAPDTQFSMMEARWGLVPDMAGIALLRGLVRDDVARDIIFTARKFGGEEAAKLGLVTRLDADPHAAALALAAQIAATSPPAIRAAKRLLNIDANASPAEILLAEAVEQEAMLASAAHKETLAAAREKRAPVFED